MFNQRVTMSEEDATTSLRHFGQSAMDLSLLI